MVRAAGAKYPTSTVCCIAFPREWEGCESLSQSGYDVLCTASASLLYLKGARTQPLDPRQVGPTMQYNVLFIHYGVAGKGDLSLGFPRLLPEPFVHHVLALSCQDGACRS